MNAPLWTDDAEKHGWLAIPDEDWGRFCQIAKSVSQCYLVSMARTARVSLAGGVFHVVSRFARDEWCLDRAGAREAYLGLLERAAATNDAQVLAYCLMSNHVHLVLVQGAAPLSRFVRSVHVGFAGVVNRSRRRGNAQGPVYAGRPRMVLVDKEAYLLELIRYVHNNPVRAGVVRRARDSAWSSHRPYIGQATAPPWLRVGYALERFGRNAERAAKQFDAFVDAEKREPRRPELSGGRDAGEAAAVRRKLGDGHRVSDGILGSEKFVARIHADRNRVAAALGSRGTEHRAGAVGRPTLREVADAVLELLDMEALELEHRPKSRRATQAKRVLTWIWVHEYDGKQIEVARMLGMETGAVSRHYAVALSMAGDFDEQAAAVVGLLSKRRRPGKPAARKRTQATERGTAMRYHVDLDET